MELRIHRFLESTKAEGPGLRACLWVQGCSIHCKGCGVPWTWSTQAGKVVEIQKIYEQIMKSKEEHGIEGVTFLGGEPFDQSDGLSLLGGKLKEEGLSIMTFSGYTYELLTTSNREDWKSLLEVTDLLIDGPFIQEQLDLSRPWVGSANQQYRFLTNRYAHLQDRLYDIPNRLEIRLEKNGTVAVNGMVTQNTLRDLLEGL
ncbi:4Fe-4S single cluster domain-containing protein [Bacillus sp. CHD6a]|uniref:4Fe-4S single cluster domain-containing protein n=1 Tax=Bacillus sp. CHD6a TaxID=1643452 RepID=UPI0006CD9061|nr:4Fe-4S single cluster domain-containing protein [Bacillus sp. CHD6a]KPB03420.1 ribonucleoside-triphosphate reductase activating protein [Bacillus sp. CHD6a]